MDEIHNSNTADGDYTVRMQRNVGEFCGFAQPPVQSGNAGFVQAPQFRQRKRDPEFHLKAHLELDENATAEDWLNWASVMG